MGILVISQADIDKLLPQGDALVANQVIDIMASTFATYTSARATGNTHDAQTPLRIGVTTNNHRVLFMPSRLNTTTSIKIVSVPLGDSKAGLPGSILVLNEATGAVEAIMNASGLTGVRTAAGSGVATRFYANPDAKRLLVVGAGAQGKWHVDMMMAARPTIKHVTIWNRGQERRDALVASIRNAYPDLETVEGVVDETDLAGATQQADIICTCTNATSPILKGQWLKPGTHINCVGSYRLDMHEVDEDTVKRATTIVVDSIESCEHEAGELVKSSSADQWTELGAILADHQGNNRLHYDPEAISLFKSVGISLQDSAIAGWVSDQAKEKDLGTTAPF
ncbi:NAD(P)-binding protein [Hesseltinella vesiculosa]|uniref:NAD(P)-binding protein n=1 Tax=Hesseltinella vesiculosa TaxID=101127 RepID=A0A1X2G810_9FUNG|nr:NAD(P)-binding protein [Hesseltinella vesiculosa]